MKNLMLITTTLLTATSAFAATKSAVLPGNARNVRVLEVTNSSLETGRTVKSSRCYYGESTHCDEDVRSTSKAVVAVTIAYEGSEEPSFNANPGRGDSSDGMSSTHEMTLYFPANAGKTASVKIARTTVSQSVVNEAASTYCDQTITGENVHNTDYDCQDRLVFKRVNAKAVVATVTLR